MTIIRCKVKIGSYAAEHALAAFEVQACVGAPKQNATELVELRCHVLISTADVTPRSMEHCDLWLECPWRGVACNGSIEPREPVVSQRQHCQSEALSGGPIGSLLPITSRRLLPAVAGLLAAAGTVQCYQSVLCETSSSLNCGQFRARNSIASERPSRSLCVFSLCVWATKCIAQHRQALGDVVEARSEGQLVASLAQWRRPALKQMCKSSLDGYKHTQRGLLAVWLHFTQRRWCSDRF